MLHHIISAHSALILRAENNGPTNPFDGVSFNLNWLGNSFTAYWQAWLGGIWALAVIAATVNLLWSLRHARHLKNDGNAHKKEEARGKLVGAFLWLGSSVVVPAIVGAIILAAQNMPGATE
ncbi:hypothetical protein ACI2IX_20085 [Leifsonia aquatica]|uniref:hypothetical protein n=1 Tax=Leifsonia aquatica TaxID=144185 RepID=UPI00384F6E3D